MEFATPDAHQRALAATSVPVGDGLDNVLTEKRVRKPQQNAGGGAHGFTRRASTNNLKSFASSGNIQATYNANTNTSAAMTTSSIQHQHHNVVSTAAAAPSHAGTTPANVHHHHPMHHPSTRLNLNSKATPESLGKEDEGCDLTATC